MFQAPFSFWNSFFHATSGGCLPVQYLLRALTTAGAGEATRSGSSRHRSTVSNTRSRAYTAGRLLSRRLLLRFYSFSCGVVRLRAHDVSNSRKIHFSTVENMYKAMLSITRRSLWEVSASQH